ncbi:MAG: hypothetical protein ACXAEU_16280 [Candidatus Hodarchaeales archaeon]|jgi:hypothetical protein
MKDHAVPLKKWFKDLKKEGNKIINKNTVDNLDTSKELLGTFVKNRKEPIHNFYPYVCGFSADFVRWSIKNFKRKEETAIIDPFCGIGTVLVEAKHDCIPSVGIDVHPLITRFARTKLNWSKDVILFLDDNHKRITHEIKNKFTKISVDHTRIETSPEFLLNCYKERYLKDKKTLSKLFYILDHIRDAEWPEEVKEFYILGLVSMLHPLMTAKWSPPLIIPKNQRQNDSNCIKEVCSKFNLMYNALKSVHSMKREGTLSHIITADVRTPNIQKKVRDCNIDIELLITSPPYPNQMDYAEMTRLELYFLGIASNWADVTNYVRHDLVKSSTVVLQGIDNPLEVLNSIPEKAKDDISEIVEKLTLEREKRGIKITRNGKPRKKTTKKYDIMMAAYFNDMHNVMINMSKLLAPKGHATIVVGDSAPYGVYCPVDKLLIDIAEGCDFSLVRNIKLRDRGGRWKSIQGSYIHNVPLKEVIIVLQKD